MRSERAKGRWSLLHRRNLGRVIKRVLVAADRHDVRLEEWANVGNHIHALVRAPSREQFQSFLREAAGGIVMLVTGARKGNPVGRFRTKLAYTRVVNWGAERAIVRNYIRKNMSESVGIPRQLWEQAPELMQTLGFGAVRVSGAREGPLGASA